MWGMAPKRLRTTGLHQSQAALLTSLESVRDKKRCSHLLIFRGTKSKQNSRFLIFLMLFQKSNVHKHCKKIIMRVRLKLNVVWSSDCKRLHRFTVNKSPV